MGIGWGQYCPRIPKGKVGGVAKGGCREHSEIFVPGKCLEQ